MQVIWLCWNGCFKWFGTTLDIFSRGGVKRERKQEWESVDPSRSRQLSSVVTLWEERKRTGKAVSIVTWPTNQYPAPYVAHESRASGHAVVRACAWSPAGPSSSWQVTTAIYATESPTAPSSHVRTCGGPIQHSWTSCKWGLAGSRWRLRTINGSRAVWEQTHHFLWESGSSGHIYNNKVFLLKQYVR
jgi:hypothetical protein